MLSPLSNKLQKDLTDVEKEALVKYVKNGGKLFVGGDTMVGLLLGYPDGERKSFNRMETRWWGKDSRAYMTDLLAWGLRK